MGSKHRLDILSPAQAEMEEIARVHMALSGPQSARSITDKIYDAMEQLTRFPLSGPPVSTPTGKCHFSPEWNAIY